MLRNTISDNNFVRNSFLATCIKPDRAETTIATTTTTNQIKNSITSLRCNMQQAYNLMCKNGQEKEKSIKRPWLIWLVLNILTRSAVTVQWVKGIML